jgi:inorganic pyrophosphatase
MYLADPSELACFTEDGKSIQVIIETPKGSRNKFAFDEDRKIFQLKKVLPVGMAFPYDFGFVPSTRAEDGDPFDVLVLMDEPAFPGCLLQCRVIGIIEGEEGTKKGQVRNDRVVAVEQANHSFADVDHIRELGRKFVRELEEFFVNYHELSGKKYRIVNVKGPSKALRRIEECMKGSGRKKESVKSAAQSPNQTRQS